MSEWIVAFAVIGFGTYAAIRTEEAGQVREWCWPFCHAWGKWRQETYMGQAVMAGVPIGEKRQRLFQARTCKRCGIQQTRPL